MTGLTRRLLRLAEPRPLVVTAVGGTACRLAVERALRERGLHRALSPSEADTLVECGPAGSGVDDAAERVWNQMSEPRTRIRVRTAAEAAARLDDARAALRDYPEQRRRALRRPAAADADDGGGPSDAPKTPAVSGGTGDEPEGSGADAAASHDHASREGNRHAAHDDGRDDGARGGETAEGTGNGDDGDHSGHGDHSDHGDHGHHDHGDMQLPGGLAMADRGDDRDGLRLDRLHMAIGPAQADWPAGLVAELTVQGDVVQEAQVYTLPPATGHHTTPFWHDDPRAGSEPVAERVRAAAAADSLQRLLDLAGWPTAAATGRLVRDTLLVPYEQVTGRARFTRWLRRVRGSRLLRWSLRGLGRVPDDVAALPDRLRGDVPARMDRWLDDIAAVVMPDTSDTFFAPPIRRKRRRPRPDSDAERAAGGRSARSPAAGGDTRPVAPPGDRGRPESVGGVEQPEGAANALGRPAWAAEDPAPGDPVLPAAADSPRLAAPSGAAPQGRPPLGRERAESAQAAIGALPRLLVGQELAAVRLIVASFDPDLEALAAYPLPRPTGAPFHQRTSPPEEPYG